MENKNGIAGAGGTGLTSFHLKIIAIAAMTCNHSMIIFEGMLPPLPMLFLHSIGGVTFPVMAFLAAEGYYLTSNAGKYLKRLLVFGIISAFPSYFLIGSLGVILTVFTGVLSLAIYHSLKSKALFWLIFAALTAISAFFDWGLTGPALILIYGILRDKKSRAVLAGALWLALRLIFIAPGALDGALDASFAMQLFFCLASILAVPPLLLSYGGRLGYSKKWAKYLFYAYYPLHMAVLIGIQKIV